MLVWKALRRRYPGWDYRPDRLISLWFYQISLEMVTDTPTGSFPFLLTLTGSFIAQLFLFCQSQGCKVCFNVHSSHPQELGGFLQVPVSLFGFPFCKLFISLCLFSHVGFLCLCLFSRVIYSWAVADNSEWHLVYISRCALYWKENFNFNIDEWIILPYRLLLFDFLFKSS